MLMVARSLRPYLVYPFALLAVLVFLLPFERIPSLNMNVFGSEITLRGSVLAGLVLIVASVPLLIAKWRDLIKMPYLGLQVFLGFYALSALTSIDSVRSVWVLCYTVFVVVVAICVAIQLGNNDLQKLETVVRWATWVVIVFGLLQFFGNVLGLPSTITGLRAEYSKEILGFPRVQSVGLEPLYYGNFLLWPLFLFSSRYLKTGGHIDLVLIGAIAMQVFLTVSRGALVAGLIGVLVLVVLGIREGVRIKRIAIVLMAMLIGLSLALGLGEITRRYELQRGSVPDTDITAVSQATNLDSQIDRKLNREVALEAIFMHPWLGVGPGGFDAFVRTRTDVYNETSGRIIVNNEPLELFAEGGLLGFTSLLITAVWILATGFRRAWSKNLSVSNWVWVSAILAYLVALAVQYQSFSTLYIMHVWVIAGLLLGIIFPLDGKRKS